MGWNTQTRLCGGFRQLQVHYEFYIQFFCTTIVSFYLVMPCSSENNFIHLDGLEK